jgi:hypothetical protein
MSKGYAQGFEQKLWRSLPRRAQLLQTSVLFRFNNLVVGTPTPVVCSIQTPQVFCGEYRGQNRSQTISEGQFLKLTAADNDRTLTDGSGLSRSGDAVCSQGAPGVPIFFLASLGGVIARLRVS